MAPETPADPAARRRADLSTISLIGVAHGTSHFFHMLLPPLFPAFIRDFGLAYAELGLLVTTFFVITCPTADSVLTRLVPSANARSRSVMIPTTSLLPSISP